MGSSGDKNVNELRGLGRLASQAVGATTTRVQEVHQAIAQRVFTAVGPASAPTQVTHDAIANLVYDSVRGVNAAVEAAASAAFDAYPAESRAISRTRWGRAAMSALNGFLGDRLASEHNDLRVEMSLWTVGHNRAVELPADIPAEAGSLTPLVPAATGKLAVFVHGLGETESSWKAFAREHYQDPNVTYGSRLADDLGCTPLYLRYNTGLRIGENGRQLAELLEKTAASWPVPVTEIALIGHSMGGLVLRAACDTAMLAGHGWVGAVRHVVYLGSPHLGAPLEKAANVAAWLLAVFPETRPFSKIVNLRSSGIKDLRFGYLDANHVKDVQDDDVFVVCVGDKPVIPLPQYANHYFVSATIGREPGNLGAHLLGDLLVLQASASGRTRRGVQRIAFEMERGRHFDHMNHFHLLNHPMVYEQLRDWLAIPPVPRERVRRAGEEPTPEDQARRARRRRQAATAIAVAAIAAGAVRGRGGRGR